VIPALLWGEREAEAISPFKEQLLVTEIKVCCDWVPFQRTIGCLLHQANKIACKKTLLQTAKIVSQLPLSPRISLCNMSSMNLSVWVLEKDKYPTARALQKTLSPIENSVPVHTKQRGDTYFQVT